MLTVCPAATVTGLANRDEARKGTPIPCIGRDQSGEGIASIRLGLRGLHGLGGAAAGESDVRRRYTGAGIVDAEFP